MLVANDLMRNMVSFEVCPLKSILVDDASFCKAWNHFSQSQPRSCQSQNQCWHGKSTWASLSSVVSLYVPNALPTSIVIC